MKFLGYIHTHAEPATEHAAGHFEVCRESNGVSEESGRVAAHHRLAPLATIRARRGRGSIVDGPYVETKEQPGESGRGIS